MFLWSSLSLVVLFFLYPFTSTSTSTSTSVWELMVGGLERVCDVLCDPSVIHSSQPPSSSSSSSLYVSLPLPVPLPSNMVSFLINNIIPPLLGFLPSTLSPRFLPGCRCVIIYVMKMLPSLAVSHCCSLMSVSNGANQLMSWAMFCWCFIDLWGRVLSLPSTRLLGALLSVHALVYWSVLFFDRKVAWSVSWSGIGRKKTDVRWVVLHFLYPLLFVSSGVATRRLFHRI